MSQNLGIIRLSKCVKWFCLAALLLLPLSLVYGWWFVREMQAVDILGLHFPVHFESLEPYQWGLAMGLSFIPVGIAMWATMYVYHLMVLFQKGEYFSLATSRKLYQFSFWLLVSALVKIVTDSLISGVLTFSNPNGGLIAVGLDSKTISTLFIVSVFFVITRIMKEGVRLADENAEFV